MANWGAGASGAASGAAAGSALGPWGAVAGGLVGGAMGLMSKSQADEQKGLTDIQGKENERLMEKSYALQRGMYDYTYSKNTPEQQVKNLQKAGLSVGLMYGQGGAGITGTTGGSGSTSVSGATASGTAEREAVQMQKVGMALQMAKLKSEIELNESAANQNNANAELSGAKTITEDKQRDMLIENMKQEGLGRWLENNKRRYEGTETKGNTQNQEYGNSTYDEIHQIMGNSYTAEGMTAALIKTQAEGGNAEAQKILNNKKAEGYYQELLNETIKAKASGQMAENDAIKTAAMKLATEWGTGEYTNWKTWADLAADGVGIVTKLIGITK